MLLLEGKKAGGSAEVSDPGSACLSLQEDRRQDSLQPSGGNWEQDAVSTDVIMCYK